ncbi:EscU/YscU/HrcU family type III secretion system export apparatus switch protein [Edaphobacter modestus]|uniref:Flagellar biosynthetic protein FlhB/type III secretion protein U n=1 Tax=Edaphobacter modestus TaxID=388466 RepID=A0A4Q7YWZ1_9BACT|nr:EscU/YscU/HrcU family type III secretion system export apparatus switch protein [Edaphobacter modestus]RZU42240.1 flagellar biosynthetic protein FlhB/type III secretion protein U [Edaphobacter modestus]
MADKTEQPTPKKLKEAREKGQIPKSNDLTQAVLFLVAGTMLSGWGPSLVEQLKKFMIDSFDTKLLSGQLDGLLFAQRVSNAGLKFLLLIMPFLAALMVAAIAVNFAQTQGLIFSPAALSPKFSKLNPIAALQGMFLKPKTYIELVKTLLKFVIILWLAYSTLMPEVRDLILSSRIGLSEVASFAPMLLFNLLFKVGGVFIVFGAADFAIQKKLYANELMMSKEEIKQEFKEQEGDPHLKGERKHLQRQLLQQAATKRVPDAKAVIVNPTHIAVAIEYDEQVMNAPRLAAKGQLQMAKRIVEIAKKHQIPVIRNIPLARSLYTLELDQEVPEDLYEAVAEILNFVAKLENTNEDQ